MTVSQPDGDGQSSSLALLIWLMMTMMVMMMPVFLPRHCPGLCPGRASPLSSLLPLLDGNTKTEGRARKRRGEERRERPEAGVGVWGRQSAQEWKLDKRRAEDRSGGGEDRNS